MIINLKGFATGPNPDYLLTVVGGILLALGVWILIEAILAFRGGKSTDDPLVALDG